MSHVVVPLSAAAFRIPFNLPTALQGFLSHALLVGLPNAWFSRCWQSPSRSAR